MHVFDPHIVQERLLFGLDGFLTIRDCLNENHALMYGILLAVKYVGDSSVSWLDANNIRRSSWGDETCGLDSGCNNYLPYAQRSRYDWLECDSDNEFSTSMECNSSTPCPPYLTCNNGLCVHSSEEHNNGNVWSRFLRVLTEGTDTFDSDNNYEQLGINFDGIGIDNTISIIYDATMKITNSTNLEDWINYLREAANENGFYQPLVSALGVVGFISYPFYTSYHSDNTPYSSRFSSWSLSIMKTFSSWIDNMNIKILYPVSSSMVLDTIDANTNTSTTMVEYHDKLYIFWRDMDTSSVKYLWYDSVGNKSDINSLESINIDADGSFDAVVLNDKMYLVYTEEWEINISWCIDNETGELEWHQFESGSFKKGLGVFAFFGLGAEVGPNLNGTTETDKDYIYVAAAHVGLYFNGQIKILQIDDNGIVRRSAWIPYYYPSCYTIGDIGVKLEESALPVNGVYRNYLYIAWVDLYNKKIYKAVLRYFNDIGAEQEPGQQLSIMDYWITWSDDTFLVSNLSTNGVRIEKGDSINLMFTNNDSHVEYAHIYGLY